MESQTNIKKQELRTFTTGKTVREIGLVSGKKACVAGIKPFLSEVMAEKETTSVNGVENTASKNCEEYSYCE